MDAIVLIGRLLFVVIFVIQGSQHLTKSAALAGYAQSKGVPFARLSVIGSGLLMLVGSVMVVLGLWGDLGTLLLIAFLLSSLVTMHAFWTVKETQARQMDFIQFEKNVGLIGGALAFFVLFAHLGTDLGLTLTGPLFNLS